MIDKGIIQGSKEQAQELIIGSDTVYVHTDIVKVEKDAQGNLTDNLYSYHEIQYEKDEYIKIMASKNTELETKLDDVQMAMCEIYEQII